MGIIAVCGAGFADPELERQAEAVGREIARRNHMLACGGLGGIMEAAARGAKAEGGLTIGILPGRSRSDANKYIDVVIVTGMGEARNVILVRTADVVIGLSGEFGTLSEIALSLKTGTPVVGLGTWKVSDSILQASNPEDAVDLAVKAMKVYSIGI